MNKSALIDLMLSNKSAGFKSKADAGRALDAAIDAIKSGVKKDAKKGVQIIGFGTFKPKTRKARKGRNPATGETINIKASKTIGFRAGKEWKEAL